MVEPMTDASRLARAVYIALGGHRIAINVRRTRGLGDRTVVEGDDAHIIVDDASLGDCEAHAGSQVTAYIHSGELIGVDVDGDPVFFIDPREHTP
jgi:hypothetical protein